MDSVCPLPERTFSGAALGAGINHSLFALLLKGSADEGEPDLLDCVRAPGVTRPLSLNNQDAKAIASAINHKLKPVAEARTEGPKQGFASGRNVTGHMLAMDTEARLAPLGSRADRSLPVF
eukprot:6025233-Pyramimonas_sp.AAC.1